MARGLYLREQTGEESLPSQFQIQRQPYYGPLIPSQVWAFLGALLHPEQTAAHLKHRLTLFAFLPLSLLWRCLPPRIPTFSTVLAIGEQEL